MSKTPSRVASRGDVDPEAVRAAINGQVPDPAPGMAGESGPSEPSRAEIFSLRPELADTIPGGVTASGEDEGLQVNEESLLEPDPEERMTVSELVPDGLDDEANVADPADDPELSLRSL